MSYEFEKEIKIKLTHKCDDCGCDVSVNEYD